MNYDFIKYSQPGGVFYATSLPASIITGRLDIRRRSENNETGIQRDEDNDRINSIARFSAREDAIFPTPIIVSAYSNVEIYGNGIISLPEKGALGHILDGQHRYLGLSRLSQDELSNIELLVVFVFDIDIYSEAYIFSTINGNQKPVTKSVMYDLFSLTDERSPEKSAHEIVRALNSDKTSPFHKKIKILGRKKESTEIISQAAFINALLEQIKSKNQNIFKELYYLDEDVYIKKIINNAYLSLTEYVKNIKDKETSEKIEKFFFKTTGFTGLIKAISEYSRLNNDFSEENFKKYYEKFSEEIIKEKTSDAFNKLFSGSFDKELDKDIDDFISVYGTGNSAAIKIKNILLKSF